jgi:hypothetical protein
MDRPVRPSQSMWAANQAAIASHNARRLHGGWYSSFTNRTILLDEAERKTVILRRIEQWREAVELQHERLTRSGCPLVVADLNFYVLAVDNLVDAVKVMLKQYHQIPKVVSAVDKAVKRFEKRCPDIGTLRDLIEHFDAYDHMSGDLQVGKGKGKGLPPADLFPKRRMERVEEYRLAPGDATLTIFGKSMSLTTTTPAASKLAADVLALNDQIPG